MLKPFNVTVFQLQTTEGFVCSLVTFVSPAKTAEPIEMPFGGLLVSDGGPDPKGRLPASLKTLRDFACVYAKTTELVEMPFIASCGPKEAC